MTIDKISTENIVKEFKNCLLEKIGSGLLTTVFFGSRARGNYESDSDIDILVIIKQPTEEQVDSIYSLAMEISSKYRIYLSVKIFSEEEFNRYKSIPTRFATNILKEGITI
ncbi:nucleotidyltransferase domain-containing protein [Candidatus Wolfebacteria bacterium]|nr:nucleotidyltransferase domain-containing protein [Candidatus Wolfebacteria bacterium]